MLRLKHLKVSGFRGFTDSQEFNLDAPVILLFGGNRAGKSSTLNAIEWCLFGSECIGGGTNIRERVDWEVANRHSPDADTVIELTLESPDGTYVLERLQLSQRRTALRITLPNGTLYDGDEGEAELRRLLGLSFPSFMATVYQHQELIRSILVMQPRDRNDAIDRLIGLADYRDILGGMTSANVSQKARAIEGRVQAFGQFVEQRLQQRMEEVEEKRRGLERQGVTRAEMTEQGAIARARGCLEDMTSFAKELGLTEPTVGRPQDKDSIGDFVREFREQLASLWGQAPELSRQQELISKTQGLSRLVAEYDGTNGQVAAAQRQLQDLTQQYGDAAAVESQLEQRKAEITRLDDTLTGLDAKAGLLEKGLQLLEGAMAGGQPASCPLCGTDVPDLLSHVRREWETRVTDEIRETQERLQSARASVLTTENAREKLTGAEEAVKRAVAAREPVVQAISLFLGREITDRDDPAVLLNQERAAIATELERLGQAVENRRRRLDSIHEALDRVEGLRDLLVSEDKKAFADNVQQSADYQRLQDVLTNVAQVEEDVRQVQHTLTACLNKEAQAKLVQAGRALDTYFRQMTSNPAVTEVTLDVRQNPRTGGNDYDFLDQDRRQLFPVMNQGDMNCLALAIFLGLAAPAAETHQIGFLMLDDPSQSLGRPEKEQLARVLDAVAQQRQLVVATMDTELQEELRRRLSQTKAVYSFGDWSVQSGPQVHREP